MRTATNVGGVRTRIQLEPVTPELLGEVIRRIVDAVDPERIILFGSHARGTPREHSDLDLFVVKAGTYHPFDVRRQIHGLFWDMSLPIDVLLLTPAELDREVALGNSFVRNQVLRDGEVLYERSGRRR